MTKSIQKLIITSSDIERLESCSKRTANERIRDIKTYFKKTERRHKVTFKEYSEYTGISMEDLDPYR